MSAFKETSMLGFIRKSFKTSLEILSCSCLVLFCILGAFIADVFLEIHAFIGVIVGIIIGLVFNIIVFGLISTIVEMADDIKQLKLKYMPEHDMMPLSSTKCKRCDSIIDKNDSFCQHCGDKL